jgi:ubiquinol-cytochrome c reductase cytochrome b subunit
MVVHGSGAAWRDRSWARVAGFVFVLLGLAEILAAGALGSDVDGTSPFFLLLYVHLGFGLYDGRFGRLRTVTWGLLVAVVGGMQVIGFLAFVLPWGQVEFWLAAGIAQLPVIGPSLVGDGDGSSLRAALAAAGRALPFVVLALDLAALGYEMRREWSLRQWGHFILIGGAASVALGLTLDAMIGLLLPATPPAGDAVAFPPLLPAWHALPVYAVLRAIPSKPGGVIVALALLWLPILWPWMRANAFRRGRMRWIWLLLCIALAAAWIGLGTLGAQPPEPFVVRAAQGLTVLVFTFFLLLPPILHRLSRSPA